MSSILSIFQAVPVFKEVETVLNTIANSGETAWLAGGCVRDGLLGLKPKDFDIATTATPDKIKTLFTKTVDVGEAFGTTIVPLSVGHVEITVFRTEGDYKDGRRPGYIKPATPEEDAQRRDFTINALYYDLSKDRVIDFVEGMKDLNQKIIRTVGNPSDRFNEDHLRMLRVFRFSAQLGWDIEQKTYEGIVEHADKIKKIAKERVTVEFQKLLIAKEPLRGLSGLESSGLLDFVIPEFRKQFFQGSWSKWSLFKEILLNPLKSEAVEVALALLLFDFQESYRKLFYSNFRFSTLVIKNTEFLCNIFNNQNTTDVSYIRKTVHQIPSEITLEFLKKIETVNLLKPGLLNLFLTQAQLPLPTRLVNGEDLMKVGFSQNKRLGEVLEKIFDLQIEGIISTKEEALNWAKNALKAQ